MMDREKDLAFWMGIALCMAIFAVAVMSILQGCASAKADSVTIQPMVGPGGAECFVFYSGTTPFGGSCK